MNQIIKIENKELLPFFFPNHKVYRGPITDSVKGLDILYLGDYFKDLFLILNSANSYISIIGRPTLDLSSNDKILDWIKEYFKIPITDKVKSYLLTLDNRVFTQKIKMLSTGKYKVQIPNDEQTIWDLMYSSSHSSSVDFFKLYMTLSEKFSLSYIEQSFITFYIKALRYNESDNYSNRYKVLLKSFQPIAKANFKSFKSYLSRTDKLAFLDFLISLKEV